MRLSKQTSYAIRILIHCAKRNDASVRASEIARLEGITRDNVLKVMSLLRRKGFLATSRGRTGGVRLARSAAEIDLGEVFRATEVTHSVEEPMARGARFKATAPAPVKILLDQAMRAFISTLDGHSLAELMEMRTPTVASRPKNRPNESQI